MTLVICSPTAQHIAPIAELVNYFADRNVMLPRSEDSVRQSLGDWLIAVDDTRSDVHIVGCASLVPLTETLVEIRSLAINGDYQGQGVGSRLVLALVEVAREREYQQVCALTLSEKFFVRLGFEQVDRWSISPKVWQACIYCSKFHHCDEVAVLMHLGPARAKQEQAAARPAAWNSLLRWGEWQPLKLAYKHKPEQDDPSQN